DPKPRFAKSDRFISPPPGLLRSLSRFPAFARFAAAPRFMFEGLTLEKSRFTFAMLRFTLAKLRLANALLFETKVLWLYVTFPPRQGAPNPSPPKPYPPKAAPTAIPAPNEIAPAATAPHPVYPG